jgi:HSP20 family protein
MLSFPDVDELSDDLRRIIGAFDRLHGAPCRGLSGLHAPPLDVIDTGSAVEVFVDLPGVEPSALQVLCVAGSLVIVGEKRAAESCEPGHAAFHVLERGFGRFARVIRLNGAIDVAKARAVLVAGELRVTLPKIDERRGREIAIRVEELTS